MFINKFLHSSKGETRILKKGGNYMNKNLFKKVVCLVIALMMMMPAMPSSLVSAAEEPVIIDNPLDNSISTVTTGSAITFTVEHYKQLEDGTFPEIADETKTSETLATTVYDDDYQNNYDGYTYASGLVDEIQEQPILEDGTTVLKLYYNLDSITPVPLLLTPMTMISGSVFTSFDGVMNATGHSTNKHFNGFLAWFDKNTKDFYVAFSCDDVATTKNLLQISYNNKVYNSNSPDIDFGYLHNTGLTIDGDYYAYTDAIQYPDWLIINLGNQTLSDTLIIGLNYKEVGFSAWGASAINVVITDTIVTYDKNAVEATGEMSDYKNPYSLNEPVIVLSNTFKYQNHYFVSWNTAKNGTGITYNPGDKFYMPDHDVVLYAQWSLVPPVEYKVEHYTQDLNTDTYSLADTDNMMGIPGDMTKAAAKNYPGFIPQTFSQEEIAADGTTVVKIYYTRNS